MKKSTTQNSSVNKQIIINIFILIIGFSIGYFIRNVSLSNRNVNALRENSKEYKFINPLLLVYSDNETVSPEYKALESKIITYIDSATKTNNASNISFYFRDLNSSLWTGVNENDKYAPGSMLKVAVLLAYLKLSDKTPTALDENYFYEPKIDGGQYFKPPTILSSGYHSVRDLIKNMIIESDNTATITLINKNSQAVDQVYLDLKLPIPTDISDFMSAKSYSVLWRVLYNSTYLNRNLSEQSMTLLSLTTFKDGLVAGVPPTVTVAHKFGEHTNVIAGQDPERELHDCGIVYPQNKGPYFICVMTRGNDFNKLESVISDISKITYNHVISNL